MARDNGIDISGQRSRKFVADDFEQYDRIYALAGDVLEDIQRIARNKYLPHKALLLMNELYPDSDMDVPDPWYGPESGYHEVYAMMERACEALIDRYFQETARPDGSYQSRPNNKP